MSMTAPQGAIKKITRELNFGKKGHHPHVAPQFRHASARGRRQLRIIQQYLGHSSLMTTIEYLHLTDTAAADARGTVERCFSGSSSPEE